jgi:benzoyl-CoA 2,3-dioxygenase component B
MQLESLAQSGFDPLARTCRFMLTEEGHHMFVGRTGVERVIQRTCDVMNENGITDPNDIDAVRKFGVIDLPTIQKKINFHYSVTLDLFGAEISTNAANAFNAGLKGRYHETKIKDDHQLQNSTYPVAQVINGEVQMADEPALSAINARLCDDYIGDCENVMKRWNRVFENQQLDYRLKLPHRAFHRQVGEFSDVHANPEGNLLTEEDWSAGRDRWLPDDADLEYILSLMKQVTEPGKFAGWVAAPKVGVDGRPGDFEYVKLAA